MAPRTMWNGNITFGIVNVPVGITKAQDDNDIRFRTLHRECGTPINEKKWCTHDEREITAEELVKGFEYAPGEFVKVEEGDLTAILPEADKTIAVNCFIDADSLDPVLIDRTYYLVPAKETRNRAGYALLRDAMMQTGRCGVASFVAWNKQHLCVIRPLGNVLALDVLHYAANVRTREGIEDLVGDVEVGAAEKKLAVQLVQALAQDFDHSAFRNEHRERVEEMLAKLCEGVHPEAGARVPAAAPTVDIMSALRASVADARATKVKKAPPPRKRATATKKRATARTSAAAKKKKVRT